MTKTSKKQKNLANPVELQEHLSHRIGNVGEVKINKPYAVGDTLRYAGKVVKVVDVLEDKIHVKNQQAPFDSFLIEQSTLSTAFDEAVESFGVEELAKVIVQDMDTPDLLVREDKSISL